MVGAVAAGDEDGDGFAGDLESFGFLLFPFPLCLFSLLRRHGSSVVVLISAWDGTTMVGAVAAGDEDGDRFADDLESFGFLLFPFPLCLFSLLRSHGSSVAVLISGLAPISTTRTVEASSPPKSSTSSSSPPTG